MRCLHRLANVFSSAVAVAAPLLAKLGWPLAPHNLPDRKTPLIAEGGPGIFVKSRWLSWLFAVSCLQSEAYSVATQYT